jgi:hypothetical protein
MTKHPKILPTPQILQQISDMRILDKPLLATQLTWSNHKTFYNMRALDILPLFAFMIGLPGSSGTDGRIHCRPHLAAYALGRLPLITHKDVGQMGTRVTGSRLQASSVPDNFNGSFRRVCTGSTAQNA